MLWIENKPYVQKWHDLQLTQSPSAPPSSTPHPPKKSHQILVYKKYRKMWVHIYLYVGFVFMNFLSPQAVEETLV